MVDRNFVVFVQAFADGFFHENRCFFEHSDFILDAVVFELGDLAQLGRHLHLNGLFGLGQCLARQAEAAELVDLEE